MYHCSITGSALPQASNRKKGINLKHFIQKFLLLITLVIYSTATHAQGFSIESKQPPAPIGSETFTSLDGRFSIALPKQISGYNPKSVDAPEGRVESVTYDWRTTEGVFMVGYIDRPEKTLESISKRVFDVIRQSILSGSNGKAKLINESDISLQGHPGRELKIEFPDGFAIARLYVVGNRIYQAIASLSLTKKTQEPVAIKALDSLKLLTQADVDAELKKKVAEATPSPLPQEPVAKKLRSDAEDEGLKGKVKTVFTESEDLSGTWVVSKRKPSSTVYFNQQGNFTKRESYDYKGNPMEITVYGYLDGNRVSDFKSIEYEYNPPPMVIGSASGEPEPKYDKRYSYKFKYKYDDKGNLKEELLYSNNGKLWTRTVYTYQGNHKEELVYDEKGALNQKETYTLDAKGNEIEEVDFNAQDNSIRDKYSYTYEYDSQGNWIKQAMFKWVTKDGKSSLEPYSVDYRTITYY